MTFEELSKQLNTSVQNLQNIVQVLSSAFAKMEDGSGVTVEPAQESGYLVGNIIVNGEDNYLFAPPQVPPLHIYNDTEKLVGVWFHDERSEDVYEKTFSLDNISTTPSTPDNLIPASYVLIDVKPVGIYSVSNVSYVFDDLIFVNSINTDSFNLRLSLQKGAEYYTIHKEGSGTVSNGVLTLRYVKRT